MWVTGGANLGWRWGDTGAGIMVFPELTLFGTEAVGWEIVPRSAPEIGAQVAHICPIVAAAALDPRTFVKFGIAVDLIGDGLAGGLVAGLVPGRDRIDTVGLAANWVLVTFAFLGYVCSPSTIAGHCRSVLVL